MTRIGRRARGRRTRRAARVARHVALLVLASSFLVAIVLGVGLVAGWWRVLPVASSSMAPSVPKGALVIVRPESFERLEAGQVIVYHPPVDDGRPLVHRVVEVHRADGRVSVRTKGDANPSADQWIAELQNPPVWRVSAIVPHAGAFVELLRTRALQLVLFPLALMGLTLAAFGSFVRLPVVAHHLADQEEPARAADARAMPTGLAGAVPMMTTVTAASLRVASGSVARGERDVR